MRRSGLDERCRDGERAGRARARRAAAATALLALTLAAGACGTRTDGGGREGADAGPPADATVGASAGTAGEGVTDGASAAAADQGAAPEPVAPPTEQLTQTAGQVDLSDYAVPDPGPLRTPLLPADIMVYAAKPFSASVQHRVASLPQVTVSQALSRAQVAVDGRTINLVAADPALYRRFTPYQAAQLDEIWDRVAGGEIAVLPRLGKRLADKQGFLTLGTDRDAPSLHIGAYSPMVPQVDAMVNPKWGKALGMVPDNALLVSTGRAAPQTILKQLRRIAGDGASVQVLGPDLDIDAVQTAFVTGGSVASAIGSFSYRANPDGTVDPDPAWVAAHITTESVPILGDVTCNRVMIPQLRAALSEIVQRGLASQIHPDEFGGCYYPRFIAYDPSAGLSNHTFGIAVDLNVPENARGTAGHFSPAVVDIFTKWGFGWGGYWSYTDPMHFELRALVDSR